MPVSRKRKTRNKKTKPNRSMSKSQELQIRGEQTGVTKTIAGKYYQGIIPSPEMMQQYQQVDPTFPSRILQLTEDEAISRRKNENKIINHAFISTLIGNLLGFLSILALSFLAYEFMINRHAEEGKWIALSIASVVGIFVIRRYLTSSPKQIDK